MTTTQVSRLERLFKVQPAERRLVALVAMVFAGIQSTHALSVNTADTLFFARFGVENLPFMFMILGIVTFGALVAYTGALGRVERRLFYPGLLLAGAALMVLLRLAVLVDRSWVYPVIWVSSNMLLLVTLTLMWNLAGDVVDTRSAKRLFPLFASAGILGGIIGNVATGPLTRLLGAPNVLLVIAIVLVATAIAARAVAVGIDVKPTGNRPLVELRRSLQLGWSSPLLRMVAVGMVLGSAVFSLVTFPFSVEVAEAFETEAEIASYLGLFSAAATTATFVVSLFVVNRLFARVGLIGAWFLVTLVYVAGFSFWLISLTLATAAVFRFVQWIAVNAIGGTARTAVFNVLRSERRGAVIAAYAAVPAQIGTIAAGVLLWVSQQMGTQAGTIIGLVTAVLFALVVWRMRRQYAGSLLDALRGGHVTAFTGSAHGVAGFEPSAEALRVATSSLTDESAAVRRMAVAMLGRTESPEATPLVTRMLEDEDAEVRLAALGALEELAVADGSRPEPEVVLNALFPGGGFGGGFEGAPLRTRARALASLIAVGERQAATDMLMALFGSEDPESRRAACRVVSSTGWAPDPAAVAAAFRSDSSDAVRTEAAPAVAALFGPGPELSKALTDRVPRVRMAAAQAWADAGGSPEPPMDVLSDGPDWAWEAAVTALSGNARQVREPVYAWAETRIGDIAEMAGQLAAVEVLAPDPTSMPATEYLRWLLHRRLAAAHRVAVRVLGLLEDEETVRLIIEGLQSLDVESRAQALEAAESIGGALGRITVPVLETGSPPVYTHHEVLAGLARNEERWMRVVALRAIAELATRDWADVIGPATNDDDPIVRDTAQAIATRMELQMSDSLETMGLVDRMLLLRSVPVFESLMFEDLEQLAGVAVERHFVGDEEIFRAGDEGSEMLVIVDGEVEYRSGDGRMVTRLGRGQHLGELTALSGKPRPASAYAVGTVSALSIDATSLSNLILDRPEVGRQMLASLAVQLGEALGAMTTPSE